MPDFEDEKMREIIASESKKYIRLLSDLDISVISILRARFDNQAGSVAVTGKDVVLDNKDLIEAVARAADVIKQLVGKNYLDHDLNNIATVVEAYLVLFLENPNICDEETFAPLSNAWERYRVSMEDIFLKAVNSREVLSEFNKGVDVDVLQKCLNYFSTKELKRMPANPEAYGNLGKKDIYLPKEQIWKALQTKLDGKKVEGNTSVIANFILNELRNSLRDSIDANHVALSINIVGDELVIRLEDDGVGLNVFQLDPKSKDYIFNKGVSATGSTGLGIANFDTRVASMGDSLYIVSRPKFEKHVSVDRSHHEELSADLDQEQTDPHVGLAEKVFEEHYSEPVRFQSGGSQKKLDKMPFSNLDHGTVFEIRLPITKKAA